MRYRLSAHALAEMERRGISSELLDRTLREPEESTMKVVYDPEVDVLRITLSNTPVEERPGVILDYDRAGNVVGIEILDASKRMENPRSLEYAVV